MSELLDEYCGQNYKTSNRMSAYMHDPLEACLQKLNHLFIDTSRLKDEMGYVEKRGGFGDVRVSTLDPRTPTARLVATKMIRLIGSQSEPKRLALRLARELKVWATLDHPHILLLLGYYLDIEYKTAILISEYMPAGDLKEYLVQEDPPSYVRLSFVRDFTDGLAYLHGQTPPIYHGDLKPANILVTKQNRAILSDFGVSRILDDIPSGLSTSNCLGGTLRYCCPELITDSTTKRTLPNDIWAWGCTAFEVLTSMIPYTNLRSEPELILALMQGRLPADTGLLVIFVPEIRELLTRCWTNEPDKRPAVGGCLQVIEIAVLSQSHTEATMMTAHQCAALDAENSSCDPSFPNISRDIYCAGRGPPLSPRAGQKRSTDELANPLNPQKRARLTFQDELHTRRAADFAAARQLDIEESLDFLDETLCRYQVVAASSSPSNIKETIKSQGITLPTLESLVQMFDQVGGASGDFLPPNPPENLPDLEPTSASEGPTSPQSPPGEFDNWRWAIGSPSFGGAPEPTGNPSGLLLFSPARESSRKLFVPLDVLESPSSLQGSPPSDKTIVKATPTWKPLPAADSWRWEGEMESNGEWAVDFRLT